MKTLKSFMNKLVEEAAFKKNLLAFIAFGILLYIIDYSPIGITGLKNLCGSEQLLDFEVNYSVEQAYAILDSLGAQGRQFYLYKILPIDIIYPVSLMFFLLCFVTTVLKNSTKSNSIFRLLAFLPLLYLLCDWGENIGFAIMLANFPTQINIVCQISNIFTMAKFCFVGLIIITIITFSIIAIMKFIQKNYYYKSDKVNCRQ